MRKPLAAVSILFAAALGLLAASRAFTTYASAKPVLDAQRGQSRLVQERLNPRLRVAGMAMTMFDSRTHLALQVVQEVNRHFPDLIFHTVIPRSVRIAEAPSYGEPLISFDARSRGAQAYDALTAELLEREGNRHKATA